jgi:anti-sigma-K factor RskA
MSNPDDIDALAAEFVLGTLDQSERQDVIARRGREPVLNAALEAWELRFGPLAETVPSVAPPSDLFDRIEAKLDRLPLSAASAAAPAGLQEAPPPPDNVIDLELRLGRWRRRALGLGLLAACLTAGIGVREWMRPAAPKNYVAVLQKDAASTAFLLSVDLETRAFTIRPVAAQPEPGKSFELWLVDSKLGPKSLGVVGDQPVTTRASLRAYDRMTVAGATYAISVEPSGGSPSGAPTGPVVFSGQLVQTGP